MITKAQLALKSLKAIVDDLKSDNSAIKKIGAAFVAFMLIPIAIMAFLFPYSFDPNKNDPYIEAARSIKAEVYTMNDIKLIDLIIFFDGDQEKMIKVTRSELVNRFEKYYYTKNPDKGAEYSYLAKNYYDIVQDLKAKGLMNKDDEKHLLDAIDLANHSDPTSLDASSVAITKGDFVLPFNHYTITAGTWAYPASFGGGWHPGVDWAVPVGTPIKAPINLTKIYQITTDQGGYGIYTVMVGQIKDDSYLLIFGHCSRINGNQSFKQNDVIAYSGNTGTSTGPHTHIEVIYFKNQTANEVIKKYKSTKDYYFGLAYTGKGDCNKVCRLRPENVFGVKYGDVK